MDPGPGQRPRVGEPRDDPVGRRRERRDRADPRHPGQVADQRGQTDSADQLVPDSRGSQQLRGKELPRHPAVADDLHRRRRGNRRLRGQEVVHVGQDHPRVSVADPARQPADEHGVLRRPARGVRDPDDVPQGHRLASRRSPLPGLDRAERDVVHVVGREPGCERGPHGPADHRAGAVPADRRLAREVLPVAEEHRQVVGGPHDARERGLDRLHRRGRVALGRSGGEREQARPRLRRPGRLRSRDLRDDRDQARAVRGDGPVEHVGVRHRELGRDDVVRAARGAQDQEVLDLGPQVLGEDVAACGVANLIAPGERAALRGHDRAQARERVTHWTVPYIGDLYWLLAGGRVGMWGCAPMLVLCR